MITETVKIQSHEFNGELFNVADFEFPILSFDQDLSTCLNVTAMDTANMDSQLLYDIPQNGSGSTKETQQSDKSYILQGLSIFNEDILPGISDLELDPSFESSHNIQDLINKEGLLFPDLSVLLPSGFTPEAATNHTEGVVSQGIEQPDPMPVVYESDYPTIQVTENQGEEPEVVVVRPEDLAALGVTLSGDLKLEAEANVESASFILESDFSSNLDESCTSVDLQQLTFDTVSSSTGSVSHLNILKADAPSKSTTRRNRNLDKNTEEYRERRQRNNVAVRKSRDKAKIKQRESEGRVQILVDDNERLQKKVDLLTKELTVLKGLFTNVGAAVPARLAALLK